jgi:hypothetical protein
LAFFIEWAFFELAFELVFELLGAFWETFLGGFTESPTALAGLGLLRVLRCCSITRQRRAYPTSPISNTSQTGVKLLTSRF